MTEVRAQQTTLRDTNLRLVLRTVLTAGEPVSRARIASATALTRSTVSRLVDGLVGSGLLDELAPSRVSGPGRPGTPLLPGRRVAALGLQVNPGYLAARAVDLRGGVVAEELLVEDLVGSEPNATVRRLGAMARRVHTNLPGDVQVVGYGVALPGLFSVDAVRLLNAPNLGWSDVPVATLLRRALGDDPLAVGNEADLAARTVAEVAPGRPGPLADFVYVSGDVGIGGAAVLGGRVFQGTSGWAGEIGHVTVDPDGPPCRCGSTGCLEQYAGLRAMLRSARLPEGSSPDLLVERVEGGNAAARRAVASAARALGIALAGVVNVLDIRTVVLGGHLADVADPLRLLLENHLHDRVLSARWRPPAVEVATHDAAPGATGAAFRVLDGVLDDPARWVEHRR
jgi:predicted NBD/HSP70 family sugar kinase